MRAESDSAGLDLALRLARRPFSAPKPNPRVGAIVVRAGVVVGYGWHRVAGGPHAEPCALAMAGSQARGATLYVTLEPCGHWGRTPPCVDAIVRAGIARIVVGAMDPGPGGGGLVALRDAGCLVSVQPCREAVLLNAGFYARWVRKRPWVRAKMGMSLDGKVALSSGQSQWITGAAARWDVQRFRADSDVIVTGVGTVLADDPQLTVRRPCGDGDALCSRQPLRVVLDPRGRMGPHVRLITGSETPIWVVHQHGAVLGHPPEHFPAHVRHWACPVNAQGDLCLTSFLAHLHGSGYDSVWLEGGPHMLGRFHAACLVDEWVIYWAPSFLGKAARSMLDVPEPLDLAGQPTLQWVSMIPVGTCMRGILRERDAVCAIQPETGTIGRAIA